MIIKFISTQSQRLCINHLQHCSKAFFMVGYLNWNPISNVLFGITFCPSKMTTDRSLPNANFIIRLGVGNIAGLPSAAPKAFANCSFVTDSGATAFNTPLTWSLKMEKWINPARSLICIHGNHCVPFPMGPPSPKKNCQYWFCIRPPSRPRTTPSDKVNSCFNEQLMW